MHKSQFDTPLISLHSSIVPYLAVSLNLLDSWHLGGIILKANGTILNIFKLWSSQVLIFSIVFYFWIFTCFCHVAWCYSVCENVVTHHFLKIFMHIKYLLSLKNSLNVCEVCGQSLSGSSDFSLPSDFLLSHSHLSVFSFSPTFLSVECTNSLQYSNILILIFLRSA